MLSYQTSYVILNVMIKMAKLVFKIMTVMIKMIMILTIKIMISMFENENDYHDQRKHKERGPA